jgi:phosphoribosyl-ATP pyrophosphohydrolase
MTFSLEELNARVLSRANADPSESYTAKLLKAGIERCAQKLGEEAVEAAIAAAGNKRTQLVSESADVLYHLLVLLHAAGITLDEVMDDLQRRTAQSGLAEKASRK